MKKKFTPTPEQKAAAQERREGFKLLMAAVKAIPTEKRILLAASYGIRNPEGRELSPYNQCLLIMQNPQATICGGFSQWAKLDRHVMKGAKSLAIWCPIAGKKASPEGTSTALVVYGSEPTEPTDAESSRASFIIGSVFDIAQTESTAEREARKAAEALTLENGALALENGALALPECASQSAQLALSI